MNEWIRATKHLRDAFDGQLSVEDSERLLKELLEILGGK